MLASKGHFDFYLFLAVLIGLVGVMGSACIFNNYIDRNADAKMERTKNRPLVQGLITPLNALIAAAFLFIIGVYVLAVYTNLLTLAITLFGFFAYVVLYTVSKYRTSLGTLIGSLSGAVPPVVGYCAVSNRFDMGAFLLFAILVLWQMPHFFAIALYRLDDYIAASIPVLPAVKGAHRTKIHMLLYIVAFIGACAMLTVYGYTGMSYLIVATLLGCIWLGISIQGFKSKNDSVWARKMFVYSLINTTLLCIMIAADHSL